MAVKLNWLIVAFCLSVAGPLVLGGCAIGPPGGDGDYITAYSEGDYEAAYQAGAFTARNAQDRLRRDEAAYIAGLAAAETNRTRQAVRYLGQAAQSTDEQLAADAQAQLGLFHYRQGQYQDAARELLRAARTHTGEDRAQAYFYAARAQQRLGQFSRARTNLMLAQRETQNPALRDQVDQQLQVTGWTVQVGAFADPENARRAAEAVADQAVELGAGEPRLITGTDTEGQSLTMVHVGQFTSLTRAREARDALRQHQAVIVPLSQN